MDERMQLAVSDGDTYILIFWGTEGWNYNLYNHGYHEIDGGLFEDGKMNIDEVLQEICDSYDWEKRWFHEVDYDELDAITEKQSMADLQLALKVRGLP